MKKHFTERKPEENRYHSSHWDQTEEVVVVAAAELLKDKKLGCDNML